MNSECLRDYKAEFWISRNLQRWILNQGVTEFGMDDKEEFWTCKSHQQAILDGSTDDYEIIPRPLGVYKREFWFWQTRTLGLKMTTRKNSGTLSLKLSGCSELFLVKQSFQIAKCRQEAILDV